MNTNKWVQTLQTQWQKLKTRYGSTSTVESVEVEQGNRAKLSQDELNALLKAEAIPIAAAELQKKDDNYIKVKVTGEITAVSDRGIRGGDFNLTTKWNSYSVMNLNTTGFEVAEGKQVKVYGVLNNLKDTKLSNIVATIIEDV